jgi:hypothetical protein
LAGGGGGQSAVAEGAAAAVVADVLPLRWSAGTAMRSLEKKLSGDQSYDFVPGAGPLILAMRN